MIRVFFNEFFEFVGRTAILEATTSGHIGQHNSFFGAEDFSDLCHEAHTAKNDDFSVSFRRPPRQVQAVTNKVSDVLNFSRLIIMRENDSVFFFTQAFDFRDKV